MDCKHGFIGDAQGVKCVFCNIRLTAEQYEEYIKAKNKDNKLTTEKRSTRVRKKGEQ